MSKCRVHRTVFGRRLLVQRVMVQGWPVAHAAKAQECRVSVHTAGSPGGGPRAMRGWLTGHRGHTEALGVRVLRSRAG